MFQTLLASAPQAPPGLSRLLASVGLHALVLFVALALTSIHPAVMVRSREARMPLLLPPALHRSRPEPTTSSAPRSPLRAPIPMLLPLIDPPPLAPPEISSSAPTVAELLASASESGATPRVSTTSAGGAAVDSPAALRGELEVDDPVQLLEQPSVGYPPALAQAGVTGGVELEFVVDTLGRVEPPSARTLASTHPEFEAAARRAVLVSRFRPARWHGQVVRQMARQSFRFRTPGRSLERDE
jgi:TonB family protein